MLRAALVLLFLSRALLADDLEADVKRLVDAFAAVEANAADPDALDKMRASKTGFAGVPYHRRL